jgi:hypothetical protein
VGTLSNNAHTEYSQILIVLSLALAQLRSASFSSSSLLSPAPSQLLSSHFLSLFCIWLGPASFSFFQLSLSLSLSLFLLRDLVELLSSHFLSFFCRWLLPRFFSLFISLPPRSFFQLLSVSLLSLALAQLLSYHFTSLSLSLSLFLASIAGSDLAGLAQLLSTHFISLLSSALVQLLSSYFPLSSGSYSFCFFPLTPALFQHLNETVSVVFFEFGI